MSAPQRRVAFVTGGSGGIGRALVQRLLANGFAVGMCARDEGRLQETAAQLGHADQVLPLVCDVAIRADVSRAIDEVVQRFGRLDAVFCAHGVLGCFKPIESLTVSEWSEVMDANLMGPVNVTVGALPHLRGSGGAIVHVSSISGYGAEPLMAPYGASKAALHSFVAHSAAELADAGVRVNCVAPGVVRTPTAMPFLEEAGVSAGPVETTMLGRFGEPDEIASIALFLASDDASYITGTIVTADGGQWPLIPPMRPKA